MGSQDVLKDKLKEMILSSCEPEGIEVPNDEDKIHYILECFNSEFNHDYNRGRYSNNTVIMWKEYLMGLPSCCYYPFYNHDIIKLATSCGYEFHSDEAEDIFLESYWMNLAHTILELIETLTEEI